MKRTHVTQQTIDPVIERRVFTLCWFCAGLGVSILQMQLLAQAGLSHRQALAPACIVSAGCLAHSLDRVDAPQYACWEAASSHASCSGVLARGWCRGALALYRQRG